MNEFHTVIDRSGTRALKWEKYKDRDVLPMWVADMDFAAPPCVCEAMQDRVAHGVFGYTLCPEELTHTLCTRFAQRYGWPIEAHWLVWLPGVVPGLSAACKAFTDPGDEVATFTPVYPPFLEIPPIRGRRLVRVPLAAGETGYAPDPETFEKALSSRTRLLFLCQPHNPVGTVFSAAELRPILNICRERNILVCSDEIHCDLILDDRPHRPVPSLTPNAPNFAFSLMSPGKTFNTAGLNLAFAVIPNPDLRQRFARVNRHLLPHPNALAYTAALAAYRHGEVWRRELLGVLRENATRTRSAITAIPGLAMRPPDATYLAWIDARGLGVPDPHATFVNNGVALSDGRSFDAPGFVRLNFGCPPALLEEGLCRIAAAAHAAAQAASPA